MIDFNSQSKYQPQYKNDNIDKNYENFNWNTHQTHTHTHTHTQTPTQHTSIQVIEFHFQSTLTTIIHSHIKSNLI